jgi:hypothetical protein
MGVPEIWLYRDAQLSFLLLGTQSYAPADRSRQFPFLPPEWLQDVLDHPDRRVALKQLRLRVELFVRQSQPSV